MLIMRLHMIDMLCYLYIIVIGILNGKYILLKSSALNIQTCGNSGGSIWPNWCASYRLKYLAEFDGDADKWKIIIPTKLKSMIRCSRLFFFPGIILSCVK